MKLGLGSLAGLPRLRDFKSRRISSWDRSEGNADAIQVEPGATAILGDIPGAGCVKHIWATLMSLPPQDAELRKAVLRCFWDGESSPSVEVPVGDFFGIGFEKSIRMTLETGHDNALANDYSSTAYGYQLGRQAPLPPLPSVEARLPRPDPPGLGPA